MGRKFVADAQEGLDTCHEMVQVMALIANAHMF